MFLKLAVATKREERTDEPNIGSRKCFKDGVVCNRGSRGFISSCRGKHRLAVAERGRGRTVVYGILGQDLQSDGCKRLAAPDMLLKYSLHEPRRGREDINSLMHGFRTAFPDLNCWGTAPLLSDGDYVIGQ